MLFGVDHVRDCSTVAHSCDCAGRQAIMGWWCLGDDVDELC